jgi:tetratricopeptide (TPR) repeat protein
MRFAGKTVLKSVIIFLLCLSGFGCGKTIIRGMGPMAARAAAAIEAYDDPTLLGRALPNLLITSEGYLGIAPDHVPLLVSTASQYGLYAMAFVTEHDRAHAIKLYRRGRDLGLRALMQNKRFAKAAADGTLDNFTEALEVFKKRDVPALYVTMSNWLSWISLNSSDPEAMMDMPKAEALMHRILALDETHYHGAIHAAFGAYYGSFSKALGGQPEKAKKHFDRAFEISQSKFLFFFVLYAETYAVQIQDRALFVKTLEKVLKFDSASDRKMTMANEIAKIKAQKLLQAVDEYFL